MRLSKLMKNKMILSFELFPPKTENGFEGLSDTIKHLKKYNPEYISCTYGAGGTNIGKNMDTCKMIKKFNIIPVTHFTCVGSTKKNIKEQLQNYLNNEINHVLALRGDLPLGWKDTNGDFKYATDLVYYIKKEFNNKIEIAVAGSPEGHISCRNFKTDIAVLKQKQDNGADYIMTQLCWDIEQFKYWFDSIRKAGVILPIDVGVMPVLDQAAIINMSLSRNGCTMPRKLCEIISRNWIFPNPFDKNSFDSSCNEKKENFKNIGIEYTIKLIDEYRSLGVNGIHLYTLNKWKEISQIIDICGLRTII